MIIKQLREVSTGRDLMNEIINNIRPLTPEEISQFEETAPAKQIEKQEGLPPLHQAACCSASIEAIRSEARNQMSYAAQQFQLRYERIAFQAAAIAVKLWEDADRLQNTESSHAGAET